MIRNHLKKIWEEFKSHIANKNKPLKERFIYRFLIVVIIFIFVAVLGIFIIDPISEWRKSYFTQESNLSIDIASRNGKDTIVDYGENRIYEVLNPYLNGSQLEMKLWLTAKGETTVHIERIKFTIVPCYWYKPIEKQQYTLIPDQTIEIPLDFSFDMGCSLVEELKREEIQDFMANLCVEVDYRTNNKFKEQLKCKNFFIATKLLQKN